MIDEKNLIEKVNELIETGKAKPKTGRIDYERWMAMARAFLSVQYEIEKMPKVGEWIPVSERLPEEDEKVLVCSKLGYVGAGWYTKNYSYLNPEGFRLEDGFMRLCHAAAWMPLPEPYKGVE